MKMDVQTPKDPKPVSECRCRNNEYAACTEHCSCYCHNPLKPSPLTGEEEEMIADIQEILEHHSIQHCEQCGALEDACLYHQKQILFTSTMQAKNKELTDKLKTAEEALEDISEEVRRHDRIPGAVTYNFLLNASLTAENALKSIRSSPSSK